MSSLNEVLEPLKTKITFMNLPSPTPGGGGGSSPVWTAGAQTGDILGIILLVIAAITMFCGVYGLVKRNSLSSIGNAAVAKLGNVKGISIALIAISIITMLGAAWTFAPVRNALAQNGTATSAEQVIAYVDANGNVTFDDGYITNNTGKDIYISNAKMELTTDVADYKDSLKDVVLTIKTDSDEIYKGKADESFDINDDIVIKNGTTSKVHYEVDGVNPNIVSKLIGKNVFETTMQNDFCYEISCDAGGAQEGDVPDVKYIRAGKSNTAPGNEKGLAKFGYQELKNWLDEDGNEVEFGAELKGDKPIKLTPNWKEAKVTLHYALAPDAPAGVSLSRYDETIGSITTPEGEPQSTVLGLGSTSYTLANWTDKDGNIVSYDNPLIVPKKSAGDYKYFEENTYTANFSYNECTVTFAATNGGKVTPPGPVTVEKGTEVKYDASNPVIKLEGVDYTASIQKEGYEFKYWTPSQEIKDGKITSNVTFTANFLKDEYNLTFKSGGHGADPSSTAMTVKAGVGYTILDDVIQFEGGEYPLVTAGAADDKYQFDGWTVSPTDSGKVDNDLVFTANYKFVGQSLTLNFAHWDKEGIGSKGNPNVVSLNVGFGTHYQINYKGNSNGDIIFTKDDGTEVGRVTFRTAPGTIVKGYRVEGWYFNNDQDEKEKLSDTGVIEEDSTFFYAFEENTVTIKYTVLDPEFPQGNVVKYSDKSAFYEFEFEINELDLDDDPTFEGAIANEWAKEDNMNFISKFVGWTNDSVDSIKYAQASINVGMAKKLCYRVWDEVGFCDITWTAHFVSPKAIYDPSDSSMTFYYDESSHNEVTNNDYKFGVNDSHLAIDQRGYPTIEGSTFPSWFYADGTPKVYPTTVIIDPSFKGYTDLRSTSMWFGSSLQRFAETSKMDKGNVSALDLASNSMGLWAGSYQGRNITSIIGLENIYTQKLEESAAMFFGSPYDSPLTTIDLSTWDTPLLTSTYAMFTYNVYLSNLKLPESGSNLSFASNVTNMERMFAYCTSLQKLHLTNSFGGKAVNMRGMFEDCVSLKTLSADSQNFGRFASNMDMMFDGCDSLTYIDLPSNHNFGESCSSAYEMFYGCESLTTLDLSHFYAWDNNYEEIDANFDTENHPYITQDSAEDMLMDCNNVSEIKISSNFEVYLGDEFSSEYMSYDGLDLDCDSYNLYERWTFFGSSSGPIRENNNLYDIYYACAYKSFSGVATFRRYAPKAVYDGDSLTFYYDNQEHPGVQFNVRDTGPFAANGVKYARGKAAQKYTSTNSYSPVMSLLGIEATPTVARIFPDWYNVTVSSNFEVSVECTIDAQNVVFDPSFASYDGLYSTSCWFCADSYGYQPFQNYLGLGNVPLGNLVSCSCMFGGFSVEALIADTYMIDDSRNIGTVINGEVIGGYPVIVEPAYNRRLSQLFSYVYFADTYGSSLKTFDFNELVPRNVGPIASDDESNGLINGKIDYLIPLGMQYGNFSALFANCIGLEKVTFPDMSQPYDNKTSESLFSIWNADLMFSNCERLTTIENLETLYTGDMRSCVMMFKNCRSLTSLNLSSWDTSHVNWSNDSYYYDPSISEGDDEFYIPYTSCYQMFTGCDNLKSITFGPEWNLSLVCCGLEEHWYEEGVPGETSEDYAWFIKVDGQDTPKHVSQMLGFHWNTETYEWEADPTLIGTYTRNKWYIDNYSISVTSEDVTKGSVTPSGEDVASYSSKLSYYEDAYGLVAGNNRFTVTPAEGYEFAYWTVEDDEGSVSRVDYVDSFDAYYGKYMSLMYLFDNDTIEKEYLMIQKMIEQGVAVPEEMYQIYLLYSTVMDYAPYLEKTNARFVAHFKKQGPTAKAVYVENASVDGRTENALYMYYDELDHSSEGTVFPIYDSTGYVSTNALLRFRDLAIQQEIMGIQIPIKSILLSLTSGSNYSIIAPSWYYSTFTSQNRIDSGLYAHELELKEIEIQRAKFEKLEQNYAYAQVEAVNGLSDYPSGYAYNTSITDLLTQNKRYYFECMIDPASVVFDSSFANYDTLQSMSMWFMADSNGKQTVKNFYSPAAGQTPSASNAGFSNVNTTSLNNMEYAFGGYVDNSYTALADAPVAEAAAEQAIKANVSAGELILGSIVDTLGYGGDYQSYGTSLEKIDLSTLDLSHTKNWSYMFANAVALKEIIFPDNVNKLSPTNMEGTFYNCESLGLPVDGSQVNENPIVGLNKFNTSKVTNMDYLFYGDSHLVTLDLSSFDTSSCESKAVVRDSLNKKASDGENSFDPDDYYVGSRFAEDMFTQCYRLSKVKITSIDDPTYKYGIKGWDLNWNGSGLIDLQERDTKPAIYNLWSRTEPDPKVTGLGGVDIPYYSGYKDKEYVLYSGTFVRKQIGEKIVGVTNEVDEDTGETKGTVNGQEEYDYGYINDATISTKASEPDVLWIDNMRLKAEPKEGYRFQYWRFGEEWGPNIAGTIVPADFEVVLVAEDVGDVEYSFTACYTDDKTSAKALFIENDDGSYTMKFVYDDTTYTVGEAVSSEDPSIVKAVYPVMPSTTDYNLPSWYRTKSQSYHAGDDHVVPAYDKVIEQTMTFGADGKPTNDGHVAIVFDDSFSDYDEISSLSCWFMPAVYGTTSMIHPFNVASITGLDNINTERITNVAYMFGGHEYFNDYNGAKYQKIDLTGFDAEKLDNFVGLFANCRDLENVEGFGVFGKVSPKSTSKMFYNCRKLMSTQQTNLTKLLQVLDTSATIDMSYMFAMYSDTELEEGSPLILKDKIFNFPNNLNFDNVQTIEGFFAGHNDTLSITVKGNFSVGQRDPQSGTYLKSVSGMFKNCTWLNYINLDPSQTKFRTSYTEDFSYLFANCTNIKNTEFTTVGGKTPMNFGMSFDTGYWKNCSFMFSGCTSLESFSIIRHPAGHPNDYRLNNAVGMLSNCPNLKTVDLSWVHIDTNATVYLSLNNVVPAYSYLLSLSNGSSYYSNDVIEQVTLDDYWSYYVDQKLGGGAYTISLADCGLASTYNNSNENVVWLRTDSSQFDRMNNYTTRELGSLDVSTPEPYPVVGDFVRAKYAAINNRISALYNMQSYYMVFDSSGVLQSYDYSSNNTISWNDDFKAEYFIGANAPVPDGPYSEFDAYDDTVTIKVTNNNSGHVIWFLTHYDWDEDAMSYTFSVNGEKATATPSGATQGIPMTPAAETGLRSWSFTCLPGQNQSEQTSDEAAKLKEKDSQEALDDEAATDDELELQAELLQEANAFERYAVLDEPAAQVANVISLIVFPVPTVIFDIVIALIS